MLKPEAKAKLNDLVDKIKSINLEVIIAVGHADSTGGDALNQKLSIARAEAVKKVLVEKMDVFGKWQSLYSVDGPAQPSTLNWTEGSSPGQIWNEAGDGRIPIYRYYNRYTDTHHFTTSLTERERLLNQAKGWLDEGTAGYVSRDPQPGLIPLYRWTKAGDPDVSLYTNGGAPSAGGSWQNQGIEGYVAPGATTEVPGMTKLYRLDNKASARGDGLYTTSITDRNALLGLPRATFGGSSHTSPMFAKVMGLSIEVSYPQDLVSKTTLEYRRYGSNDGWTTAPVGIQTSFGSAHRFDVSQFPAGNYEYRVRNTNAQMTRDVGSGTFTIGAENVSGNLPPLPGGDRRRGQTLRKIIMQFAGNPPPLVFLRGNQLASQPPLLANVLCRIDHAALPLQPRRRQQHRHPRAVVAGQFGLDGGSSRRKRQADRVALGIAQ